MDYQLVISGGCILTLAGIAIVTPPLLHYAERNLHYQMELNDPQLSFGFLESPEKPRFWDSVKEAWPEFYRDFFKC